MKYKVLWIDDDCNTTGRDFIGQAEQDDVDITAFESHEEGIAFLENNLTSINAIILDAKVKHMKNDTVTNLEGLRASRDRIIELNNKVDLPYFIFTGQPDYQTNELFKQSFGNFYTKGIDNERLIADVIKRIEQSEDYILKKQYQKVFEVCTPEYIGTESIKNILKILSSIRHPNTKFEDDLYFTQIRITLEYMFRAANKFGLLHDACISNGKVNLTESSLFLAGLETKHLKVKCKVSHFPKMIADSVQSIIFITGAASHTTAADTKNNINLLTYRKLIKTPYLLYSLSFQLMDVLIWFKEYLDMNLNIDLNKKLWINLDENDSNCDWITGTIVRIEENGWGAFQPSNGGKTIGIPKEMVSKKGLDKNDLIKIITIPSKDGTKTFIKDLTKEL